jgi:hypothetical protein
VHSFTTRPIYPWKPVNRVLDGPPHFSERSIEEKDFFLLPGIEAQYLERHAQSLATITTELSGPDLEQ